MSPRTTLLRGLTALSLSSLALSSLSVPAQVYLHPAPETGDALSFSPPPSLSPSQAHAVLSHHLGIDRWVDLTGGGEWLDMFLRGSWGEEDEFGVGSGEEGGVFVLVQTEHPEDILPDPYQSPTFSIPTPPPYKTFQSLAQTYASRLSAITSTPFNATSHATSPSPLLLDIFDLSPSSPAVEQFVKDIEGLMRYAEWVDGEGATGAAFVIGGLGEMERGSEVYRAAAGLLRASLSVPALSHHKLALLTLPPSPSLLTSRASPACYTSNTTCLSATSNCSGHGTCAPSTRAGSTCYTCRCGKSMDALGRNVSWAGPQCEKVDISGSFTLLIGSTLFLIVIALGSIMLLASVGSQTLPNTLVGAAPSLGGKRVE